ncbi:MAG: hypothetical protein R2883_04900 [Caldisericia bacterium]
MMRLVGTQGLTGTVIGKSDRLSTTQGCGVTFDSAKLEGFKI